MANDHSTNVLANRSAKVLGETFLFPGTSLLLDGEVLKGAVHVALGIAARTLLGPLGWGLVAANSYSNSVHEKNLWERGKAEVASAAADSKKK